MRKVVTTLQPIRWLENGMIAVAAAIIAGTTPAPAQDKSEVNEIIVTSQRREENIQRIPLAVTNVSESFISQTGISGVADLALYVPGLQIDQQVQGGGRIYLRGVGNNISGVGAEANVAVYLDGIYLSRISQQLFDFIDVERVEVLRGPQGTLYGRNSSGGALKIITKKPTNEFEAKGDVEFSNFDGHRIRASANLPVVSDKLAIRAAGIYVERDQFGFNQFLGNRLKGKDALAGRLSVLFTPTDSLSITLSGDVTDDNAFGITDRWTINQGQFFGLFNNFGGINPPNTVQEDPFRHNSELTDPRNKMNNRGLRLEVDWDLGAVSVTSLTGWRDNRYSLRLDADNTFVQFGDITYFENAESISQELQITSDESSKLKWMLGAYYFHEKADDRFNNVTNVFGLIRDILGFNPPFIPPTAPDIFLTAGTGAVETDAYAVFAHGSYDLTDKVVVSAGLRYSYEKKSHVLEQIRNNITTGFMDAVITFPGSGEDGSETWDSITPNVSAQYYFTDDVMTFFTVSKGFKSGGFNSAIVGNPAAANLDLQAFGPENMWAYELGAKTQWFDGGLTLNGSVFYYDYKNLQVSTFVDVAIGAAVDNSAQAEIFGAEAEFIFRPLDGLEIAGNFTWLDAEFTDFVSPTNEDLAGNQLVRAPDLQVSLVGKYTFPLGSIGDLTLAADWRFSDQVFFAPDNQAGFEQGDYSIVGARAIFSTFDDRLSLAAWVKNASNITYAAQGVGNEVGGGNLLVLGAPRTYGVTGSFSF